LNLSQAQETFGGMQRRRFLRIGGQAGLGLCLMPVGCSHRQQSQGSKKNTARWQEFTAQLEKDIPGLMEKATLPGMSIVLIRDARIHWRRGFGMKDNESRQPVDNDTIFQAASMSKPVFAYAVMKLCEKGVLGLDTPLTQYTPERFVAGDPRLDLITPRHVLSHTSGLQNWRSQKNPPKIHFNPGQQFRYSGEGYYYLQSVVTRLTGKVKTNDCATYEDGLEVCATDFDDYMKANVLLPFGMTSSGYTWNPATEQHMARGHDRSGTPLSHKKPKGPGIARYGSAGALLATPTDYAKFLIEVINPKPADAFRLNASSLKEMLRPHVKTDQIASWALGWAIYDESGAFIGHGGDNKGFHCFAVASVKDKAGYVIMTNGDGGTEVLKSVMERINNFLDS
jgi:CubicO group peptidase (beta-lactamase class C family)